MTTVPVDGSDQWPTNVIDDDCPKTPSCHRQNRCTFSPIPERRKLRKKRHLKRQLGITVIEGVGDKHARTEQTAIGLEGKVARHHAYARLTSCSRVGSATDAEEVSCLPEGYAEDYLQSQVCSRLPPKAIEHVLEATSEKLACSLPGAQQFDAWLSIMQTGFSLLLHGVGSKREVLHSFVQQALVPWGADIVSIDGFNARFSLQECLRDVLEQLHPDAPRLGGSAEGLAAAIRAVCHRTGDRRRLCFVVHSLEVLQQAQQAVLASLTASNGIYLAASVDSIWAPLLWNPMFNFCHMEVHTWKSYDTDFAMRFPAGLPAWSGLGRSTHRRAPTATISLILRTLTNDHHELVEVLAAHQMSAGGRGISMSALLKLTAPRLIATNVTKLQNLLNELLNHAVVAQKTAADGSMLFHLTCDENKLSKLAKGEELDDCENDDDSSEGE